MSEENSSNKNPLIRYVNRQQMSWRAVDVERLIGEDHAARAIWTLVGRLVLSSFYRAIESREEEGELQTEPGGTLRVRSGREREKLTYPSHPAPSASLRLMSYTLVS